MRIGLIGYGIGKIYAAAFQSVNMIYSGLPKVELYAVATAGAGSSAAAQAQFGFSRTTQDYRDLLVDPDVDALVIALPNAMHRAVLLEALPSGKPIFTDKPLTTTLPEAREVLAAANALQRDLHVNFCFRFSPAMQRAAAMIRAGDIGELYSFRGEYLRSSYIDPSRSVRWKGDAAQRGGSFDDLGSHLLDLFTWMLGMPEKLVAQKKTFLPTRRASNGQVSQVTSEDHAWAFLQYPHGCIGTLETSRVAAGRINDVNIEITGSKGALRWEQTNPNYLYFADASRPEKEVSWLQLPIFQDYPGAVLPGADYPVGMMRYHIASAASFIQNTVSGSPYQPGLNQAYQVQRVLDAAHDSAEKTSQWVDLNDYE